MLSCIPEACTDYEDLETLVDEAHSDTCISIRTHSNWSTCYQKFDCGAGEKNTTNSNVTKIVLIVISCVVTSLIIVVVIYYYIRMRRKSQYIPIGDSTGQYVPPNIIIMQHRKTSSEMQDGTDNYPPVKKVMEEEDFGDSTPASDAFVDEVVENVPWFIKAPIEKAKPVLYIIADIIDRTSPILEALWYSPSLTLIYIRRWGEIVYKFIIDNNLQEYSTMLIGILMMLFGGFFMMIIASIEAVRICGWSSIKDGVSILYNDYIVVKAASDEDDLVDENNDGIADVLQISKKQLISRKVKLFLKSCNPQALSTAMTGIYAGLVAIFSCLRMQFARTVALGAAIGDVLNGAATKFLGPILRYLIPKEYHKWVPVVINYVCKTIGISIALTITRILSAFHSAVRGAQIFMIGFATYSVRHGFTTLSQGYWDDSFAAACALFGLYLQLVNWFQLPWILYILLFPFVVVENILQLVVAYEVF